MASATAWKGHDNQEGSTSYSQKFGSIIGGIVNFVRKRFSGDPKNVQQAQFQVFFYGSAPDYCVQCHKKMLTADYLCSGECTAKFWEHVQYVIRQQSNKEQPVCSMPGCDKVCFVEKNGRIHAYCGRTHAESHRQMKQYILKQKQRIAYEERHGNGSGGHKKVTCSRTDPIRFYNKYEDYYEFTNFYPAKIRVDEKMWNTSEHYFQAQKFIGTPFEEMIRLSASPREVFEFSRMPNVSHWCRSDWEEVKIDVMRKALLAKFSQYEYLRRKLLETKGRDLIEHSPYDSFWGDGGDGSGKNWLGKLLVEIRDEVCAQSQIRSGSTSPHRQLHQTGRPTDGNAEKDVKMDTTDSTTHAPHNHSDKQALCHETLRCAFSPQTDAISHPFKDLTTWNLQ